MGYVDVPENPFRVLPRWLRESLIAGSVLLCALLPVPDQAGERTSVGYVAAVLAAALVLFRDRYPRAVLAACVGLQCVSALTFTISPVTTLASMIALYTVSTRSERRDAAVAGLVASVPILVATSVALGSVTHPFVFPTAVQAALALALGQAVRVRRDYIAAITDRALRAEATREAEASRRVAEDRLRIARDLHDAVAHQITVISLNAGVASSAIPNRPETAKDALRTVRDSSRLVLREIGDLLATLRAPGDIADPDKSPSMGGLDTLVASFAATGLTVIARVNGDLSLLSPAVDIVAYRVVQEALTNALRHGTGSADLGVEVGEASLCLRVTNPVGDQRGISSGHGLVGMGERVASVRGTISHEVVRGEFVLTVRLPLITNGSNG